MPDTISLRQSAHGMIAAWGGIGQFVRGVAERDATMAIMDYTWQERQTVAVDNLVKIRVSLIALSVVPDELLDIVKFKGKKYKISAKPRATTANGDHVFLDLDCIWVEDIP